MAYRQLTPAQANALRERFQPTLRFLLLCKRRLDERGFDPRGKFYQSVCNAHDAMHTLHLELHYESCGRGVGRPPSEG
jgi:hypothetical protein